MTPPIVHLVAAARPNFMKVAPIWHALSEAPWCIPVLVHTGQHYDADMSDTFLRDLGLPEPHHRLGAGSGSHATQTAAVMVAYERVCIEDRPAWTVVVGDVNSTMACAITAAKLLIPVAHLEAGLRSRDRTMPEEVNRIVTDAIADLLWTPSPDADENLRREGASEESIERVGNVMIDSLELLRDRIEAAGAARSLHLPLGGYALVTFHRPANVDRPATLAVLVDALESIAATMPVVFPVHPRTRQRLIDAGLIARLERAPGVRLTSPLGYIEFMSLVLSAQIVITDSGGVQEETTYVGIPCLTVRSTTERPITVSEGTNRLVRPEELAAVAAATVAGPPARRPAPDLWDGRAASRVAESLRARLS